MHQNAGLSEGTTKDGSLPEPPKPDQQTLPAGLDSYRFQELNKSAVMLPRNGKVTEETAATSARCIHCGFREDS
ncbi:hypothetical protein AXF15_05280 [Desulfomicrobium orale DSM 12838]|uniref:Uncharacterized protein n=1 Tax=Desulfomicrobium orale DSM 12838 TaxID=888061 RepID=A0A0X8JPJ6_9BACT|nr:hypothetical protein AXF15_05280 [Desulfomicrobium orale DSM 12838]